MGEGWREGKQGRGNRGKNVILGNEGLQLVSYNSGSQ